MCGGAVRLLALAAAAAVCRGYRGGAPAVACGGMTPGHGPPAQDTPMPYNITLSTAVLRAGRRMTITISHGRQLPFKGFFVQVRYADDPNTSPALGRFMTLVHSTVDCQTGQANGISHADSREKTSVTLLWQSPLQLDRDVVFRVSVVQDYSTFWVGHDTPVVRVLREVTPAARPDQPPTRPPVPTTTEREQQRQDAPVQESAPQPAESHRGAKSASCSEIMTHPQGASSQDYLIRVFQNVDKDRGGHISSVELGSALSNGTWQPFNPETVRLMIGMFDRNWSGQIEFEEFAALWKYATDWQGCFRSFDRDGSDNIDLGELRNALTTFGYRFSEPFVSILIRRFDRSGKGVILLDDFIQCCVVLHTLTVAFRQHDTDMDGIITTIQYEQLLSMVLSLKL